jgi:hypothetical protein
LADLAWILPEVFEAPEDAIPYFDSSFNLCVRAFAESATVRVVLTPWAPGRRDSASTLSRSCRVRLLPEEVSSEPPSQPDANRSRTV